MKSGRKNYEGQCFRGGALPLPVGNILCDQKRNRTVLCLLLRGDKEPSLSLLSPYVCLGVDRGAIPQSGHLVRPCNSAVLLGHPVRPSCLVIWSGHPIRSPFLNKEFISAVGVRPFFIACLNMNEIGASFGQADYRAHIIAGGIIVFFLQHCVASVYHS